MLALRLARGADPLVQLSRLAVAAASAGVGFLLLSSLAHAAAHPAEAGGSAVRLLWCALPLAAAVQLAVTVARTDPATRPRRGLSSAGLGPAGLALLAASSTVLSCVLGSGLALLVFLVLRADTGAGTGGGAAALPGPGVPLPFAAVFTLLAVAPALAGAATVLTLRPRAESRAARARREEAPAAAPEPPAPVAGPAGLPWGVALTAGGLALGAYAKRAAPPAAGELPLPGGLDGIPLSVVGGWALIAVGLVAALPGLTQLCGRLLAAGRPGAVRLLAGRVLQAEAGRIGRPLGVLCAVITGAFVASRLHEIPGSSVLLSFGPLTGIGATLVLACTAVTVLTVALEARAARSDTTAALLRIGAPAELLRRAAALRTGFMVAVLAPVTWTVAALAALPLTG